MSTPVPDLTAPPPPRSPWQRFYGAAHRLRGGWYRNRARRLPRPVVSVGNLCWGGAGKTPLVAAVAAHLRDEGRRVAILTRGYRSRGRGVRILSTWAEGPLSSPEQAGDEPVLLAGELPGVAVVVSPDRHAGGTAALAELSPPPGLFLLDDGFSHLALARDLDLLAFPLADPFGGGRLPPSGRLREPLAAAGRAHAALLTGPGATPEQARRLAAALAAHGFRGRGFAAPTEAVPARRVGGEADGAPLPAGSTVFLATAIARPAGFRALAAAQGFTVAGEAVFADHHGYPEASLRRIEEGFAASGAAAVLTTSKDRVKLTDKLARRLPLAELPIRTVPEAAFFTWLTEQLEGARLEAGRPGEGPAP